MEQREVLQVLGQSQTFATIAGMNKESKEHK